MKIKTNVRAGKGGASGAGQNSAATTEVPVEVVHPAPAPVVYYPVARCAGL